MGGPVRRRWWCEWWLALALLWPTALAPAQHGPGTAPQVHAERPTVRGSLPVELAQRLLRRRVRELKACYERQLRTAPTLEGKFTLRLVIGAGGRVEHAEARRRQGLDEELFACVVRRARAWTFPSSGAGLVIVDWPVRMSPPTQGLPPGYGG